MVEMPFYDKRVRNAFEEEFIHKLGLSLFSSSGRTIQQTVYVRHPGDFHGHFVSGRLLSVSGSITRSFCFEVDRETQSVRPRGGRRKRRRCRWQLYVTTFFTRNLAVPDLHPSTSSLRRILSSP